MLDDDDHLKNVRANPNTMYLINRELRAAVSALQWPRCQNHKKMPCRVCREFYKQLLFCLRRPKKNSHQIRYLPFLDALASLDFTLVSLWVSQSFKFKIDFKCSFLNGAFKMEFASFFRSDLCKSLSCTSHTGWPFVVQPWSIKVNWHKVWSPMQFGMY